MFVSSLLKGDRDSSFRGRVELKSLRLIDSLVVSVMHKHLQLMTTTLEFDFNPFCPT